MTTDLDRAYRATTYQVFLPGGAVELRVDGANPALAAWLREEGVEEWAVVTAANPASQPLSARENAERQAKLEVSLLEEGFEPYAGENVADDPAWPVEESCFIPDISREEAVALAQQFGQNAILWGEADGLPRLVWIGDGKE
ncbi:MAG TPA: DUF3293 domain-containing protein [Rhodocyclaceae bacterium]|nr:DUF3293 domain-containing protein [Rhodocyclaceae bacterium]